MKEIIVVDDHPLVLAALKNILSQAFPDVHVHCISSLGELKALLGAAQGEEEKGQPLLAFVAVDLPGASGMEVVDKLRSRFDIPVIAMSGFADPEKVRQCAIKGVAGFIEKSSNVGVYPAVANLVLSGEKFFPSEYAIKGRTEALAEMQITSLTARQKEVLNLVVNGKPNKIIAAKLGLSEGTVKNHVGTLLERFKVRSRTQLILATTKSHTHFEEGM